MAPAPDGICSRQRMAQLTTAAQRSGCAGHPTCTQLSGERAHPPGRCRWPPATQPAPSPAPKGPVGYPTSQLGAPLDTQLTQPTQLANGVAQAPAGAARRRLRHGNRGIIRGGGEAGRAGSVSAGSAPRYRAARPLPVPVPVRYRHRSWPGWRGPVGTAVRTGPGVTTGPGPSSRGRSAGRPSELLPLARRTGGRQGSIVRYRAVPSSDPDGPGLVRDRGTRPVLACSRSGTARRAVRCGSGPRDRTAYRLRS
jgi:hypothetical protein